MNQSFSKMAENQTLPLVSVLIPLYNEEKYIAQTIECCLNQTYKNIEVIVIDDHSTDKSLAIAKSYESERVHVYENPNQQGVSSARNYAFEKSTGQFIKYLDSDDYFTQGMIEKQIERILADGEADSIVYSQLRFFHMPDKPEDWLSGLTKDYQPATEYIVDMFRTSKHLWFPLMYLFPRSVVEKTGGWNTKRTYCEDTEFIATAISLSQKMLFVDEEYAVWRVFEDNKHLHALKSPQVKIQKIEVLFYMSKLILNDKDTAENRAICSRYISYSVYNMFLMIHSLYDYIEELFEKNKLTWMKYENPRLHLLYKVLGWRRATTLILKTKALFSKTND